MKLKTLITQISALVVVIQSAAVHAHEGAHAAGQTHVAGSHMGLMEVALATIALVAFGAWKLKEVKSKK